MDGRNDTENINWSRDEFIKSIYNSLYKNGLPEMVKTELRHRIISTLNSSSEENSFQKAMKQTSSSSKTCDIYDLALNSLVVNHFEYSGLYKTMSVFLTECGLQETSILSCDHALKVFGISPGHPVYDSTIFMQQERRENMKSNLMLLISSFSSLQTENSIINSGTKRCVTDFGAVDENGLGRIALFTARMDLDRQLKDIESKYSTPNLEDTIEEKVQRIQSEYDYKLKQQLWHEMEKYKDECLSQIKIEESIKAQKEMDSIRKSVRMEYEFRLQREKEYFEKKIRQVAFEKELIDMENHNIRKQLIAEMDNLKRVESERIKSLDIQKQGLEYERNQLRQQMSLTQVQTKTLEAKEMDMKMLVSKECKRAHIDATRNYLAATEAVQRQSDFYTKELLELTKQRELLSKHQTQVTKEHTSRLNVGIQTDDNYIMDSTKIKSADMLLGDKAYACEEKNDIQLLEQQIEIQKAAFDESRAKIFEELIEAKNQVSHLKQLQDKVATERDLALDEVKELRKLLSASRRALACIHEPYPLITMSQNDCTKKTAEWKTDSCIEPVGFLNIVNGLNHDSVYPTIYIPKDRVQGLGTFPLNYNYSEDERGVLENFMMRRCMHEQDDPINPSKEIQSICGIERRDNHSETVEFNEEIKNSPVHDSDNMDMTYGSCEFDDESESESDR